MILQEAYRFLPKDKGFAVTISVPGGKELAKRTYNPKLGIVGGISIIGTTGIVEPKSLDAYKTSLALELNVLKALGIKRAVLVLGYVGEKYVKEVLKLKSDSIINPSTKLRINGERNRTIKIGDHVGFMLKQCAEKGFKKVLLIGHIGKLIKITSDQFNTHCKFGDERVNSMAQYAKLCGADKRVIEDILTQTTAEATIGIIEKAGLMNVFKRIAQEVAAKAQKFVKNKVAIECILLSLEGKVLGNA
jgi:cobalt-precorrin-5B (C1)-methyltransferase